MFDQTEMKTIIVVSTDCYDDDDEQPHCSTTHPMEQSMQNY